MVSEYLSLAALQYLPLSGENSGRQASPRDFFGSCEELGADGLCMCWVTGTHLRMSNSNYGDRSEFRRYSEKLLAAYDP